MPDPALLLGLKRLMSRMPDTKEEYHTEFLMLCIGYRSISQDHIMFPPGRSPCGKAYFRGREKLKVSFLRSFFAFVERAAGFFWLYRKVKKGKPYVKTENQDPVGRGGSPDGGYGRGISEVLPPVVAGEKAGAEEQGSNGGKRVYGRIL